MTMKTISIGDRGAAIEDIQRRLLFLGYQLGTSGIDGVFLEDTQNAIRLFQEASGLPATGLVDDRTWSVLVDSSFAFGDRLLYLRAPFFHGNDVARLQEALNTLGFYCGAVDAIFGTWTERAVSEFQLNSGLANDGVVGAATFDALMALRHIWGGKSAPVHSAASGRPRSRNALLSGVRVELTASDGDSYRIARRVANLAQAAYPQARFAVCNGDLPASRQAHGLKAASPGGAPVSHPLQIRDGGVEGDLAASGDAYGLVAVSLGDMPEEEAGGAPVLRVTLARTACGITLSGDRNLTLPIPHEFSTQASQQGFQHLAAVILDTICRL